MLGGIAFFAQYAKGATDSLWMTGAATLGVIVVFLFSFRYGMGGFERRDIFALIAAGISLVLWYFTKEAAIALLLFIFIDSIGTALTVLKTYEHPGTETISTYALAGTAGVLASLAVGSLNLILLVYPLYIVLGNFFIVLAYWLGKRRGIRTLHS